MIRAWEAWERFWFAPTSTSVVALWRIAFGLVALAWTVALGPDLFTFFSDDGIQSTQPRGWSWTLLEQTPGGVALVALYSLLLLACLALIVGFQSRLAALIVFVLMLSFQRRMPWILNSGDVVLRVTAFFMIFAPSGAALSVDRWRNARDRFWEFPKRAPWALRLMQVQLSVIYLSAVWSKMQGDTWNNGTAVYYAFSVNSIHRFPVPDFVLENVLLVNLLTYGTLLAEASIGVLVWNRVARPYVLALGVGLHLGIDYAIEVVLFSQAIFVAYTAFVSPRWLDARLVRLRARLTASRFSPLRAIGQAGRRSAQDVRGGLLRPAPRGPGARAAVAGGTYPGGATTGDGSERGSSQRSATTAASNARPKRS